MIKNGSEKQNNWADQIVSNWIKSIDIEIETQKTRISYNQPKEVEFCSKYMEILEKSKAKALVALESKTSKQIIDMYVSKNMLDKYVISMSQKMAGFNN